MGALKRPDENQMLPETVLGMMRRELKSLRFFFLLVRRSTFHSTPSSSIEQQTLEESIRAAIETKTFHQIPDLFSSPSSSSSYNKKNPNADDDTTSYSYESSSSNNPFCFLSSLSQSLKTQIIDDILQSFIPLRPRSRPHLVYSYLLSYTLHYDPTPFPISLAVLQRTLRSGCLPPPQTHLSLSSAWLHRRQYYSSSPPTTITTSVSDILLEMRSIGYRPDIGTCNYLLTSLCGVDELEESVRVLEGMSKAGCDPDSESYGAVISAMSEARRSREAEALLKSMVASGGLAPRQGTVGRVVSAMRANGEVLRAVEIVRWLEGYIGGGIGFEVYEMVVEGCVERGEIVLAGEVVVEMAERGFIPYIRVRQKVYEQLLVVGQVELASLVRQKLAALNS